MRSHGEPPRGMPLARLLAMAFRQLIDGLHDRLAERGWSDLRPPYGFVLLAVKDAPQTATDLTALLGTTKQATSQLLEVMEAADYVTRRADPDDARVKRVAITDRGQRLLTEVEAIYAELEAEWAAVIGEERVQAVRADLEVVVRAQNDGRLPPVRPTW
jgi:DNA-binding MarR family transcriptional regulator